jgi:hypothetical protein
MGLISFPNNAIQQSFACWMKRAESDSVHLQITRCAYTLFLLPMVFMKFSVL